MSQLPKLAFLCCLAVSSCSSAAPSDTQAPPATPSSPICGQSCQDDTTGYALDQTLWLLWNENIAGQPSGTQSLTAQCPIGGTVQITGTTKVASNGIDTVHLSLDLQNCENSNTTYALAFAGALTWDGTFGNGIPNAVTFKSSTLSVSGTIRQYDMPAVMESCAVSLTDTYDKSSSRQTGWLNGALCNRAVAQ